MLGCRISTVSNCLRPKVITSTSKIVPKAYNGSIRNNSLINPIKIQSFQINATLPLIRYLHISKVLFESTEPKKTKKTKAGSEVAEEKPKKARKGKKLADDATEAKEGEGEKKPKRSSKKAKDAEEGAESKPKKSKKKKAEDEEDIEDFEDLEDIEDVEFKEQPEPEPVLNTLEDYNTLLQKYVREWKFHNVPTRFEELKQKGLKPDITTYKAVIEALCFQGKTNDLEKIKQEVVDSGLKPDTQMYNMLMRGYNLVGKEFDKVWGLFDEMSKLQTSADISTINSLIDACGFHGKLDMIDQLLTQARDTHKLTPDVNTWKSLIEAYMRNSEVEKAVGVLDQMKQQGIKWQYKVARAFLMKDMRFLDSESDIMEDDENATPDQEDMSPFAMWRYLKDKFFGLEGNLSKEDEELFENFLQVQSMANEDLPDIEELENKENEKA
eukprot:CAMPEP_0168571798 /NCGR_PEP_ID=MMETSP0413-20121227/17561_1 /TAXON_ID=136452 /ORGANISM="Filamoeba nolandi, Strain NC-AS-23-1" /LENGTH=439 /DNA_ID=CAMNT_0008604741 /DNA_START=34 /DNA_END=1350 /DNA_ORIENTATION=+